ncbi:hypothetical protein Tco_0912586 [Tanacetum coccineum]
MTLMELMELCTKLSERVLALENIKSAQDLEITNLKKKVKRLEKKKKSRTSQLKRRLFKVGIVSFAENSLGDQEDASKQGRNELDQDEEISCVPVSAASLTRPVDDSITDDITLAKTLMKIKKIGEFTIEEGSKLFVELKDKRKKHFAKLRAEEQRRKPPTKTQKRNQISTYLKNMAGYKHTQLKSKSYDEIQKLFDKQMKRVKTFMAMDSEVVEGSGKKAESSGKEAVSKK